MIKENELTKRNLMVTLKSMTIEGDTIFVDKDGEFAGSYLHDKWVIPFDYDEPVPLSFIDNIGAEFVALYKKVYGRNCNAAYVAEQHLMKIANGELSKTLVGTGDPNSESMPEEAIQSIDDVKITRPNYGIGKQMRAFWKHQKYGSELFVDEVYELFHMSFPKLTMEVFLGYLKAPSKLGGIHLVVKDNKVRKVDNSPMVC